MRYLKVFAVTAAFSIAAFAQESKPLESKGASKPPTVTYEPMQSQSGSQQQNNSTQTNTSAQPSATQSSGGATGQAGGVAPGQTNSSSATPSAVGATAGANQSTTGASQTANGTTGTMPQTGASAAPSSANNISGCLQRGFANYRVADNSGTVYDLRGNTANLSSHEDRVVQIQGIRDTQPGSNGHVIYYIQNVQDTGQVCGNNSQSAAGNVPVTGQTGNEGTELNSTNANGQTPTPGVETPGAMANPSPGTGQVQPNSPNGATGQGNNQNTQPGAPPNMSQAGQSAGAASENAGAASRAEIGAPNGTLGVNGNQPNNSQQTTQQPSGGTENKGVPTSGSPTGQQATTPNNPR